MNKNLNNNEIAIEDIILDRVTQKIKRIMEMDIDDEKKKKELSTLKENLSQLDSWHIIENLRIFDKYLLQKNEIQEKTSESVIDAVNKENYISIEEKRLLNKPYMTETDIVLMKKTIKYLTKNWMFTEDNIKLLKNIKYANEYIEISWIKISREPLVPDVQFQGSTNLFGVYLSDTDWIYKTIYNWKNIYHMNIDKYADQCKNQNKEPIKESDIMKIINELPWKFIQWNHYIWDSILWFILGIDRTGYVNEEWLLVNEDYYWYISYIRSLQKVNHTWVYEFGEESWMISSFFEKSNCCNSRYIIN